MKGITLFTGFDGAGIGMRAAGVEIIGGVEYDQAVAEVAQANGSPVDVIDILEADPSKWAGVEAVHASPVCTRASVANSAAAENEEGLKEAPLDIEMAEKTIEFVRVIRPRIFTLENVWQYRNFQSFKGGPKTEGIVPALMKMGYQVKYWHVNAADYGVPQTRRRLILVARLDGTPVLPEATHTDPAKIQQGQGLLFGEVKPWVGWYETIEDLIPTLPPSQFAQWQIDRLPADLKETILTDSRQTRYGIGEHQTVVHQADPVFTVSATSSPARYRAYLVDPSNATRESTVRAGEEPSYTITATMFRRQVNEPRAFFFNGQNYTSKTIRAEDKPFPTVTSSSGKGMGRAWLKQGRVVKMTTRALARFQTFPDSYVLPDNVKLACKGIGNAVPPLLIETFYKANL